MRKRTLQLAALILVMGLAAPALAGGVVYSGTRGYEKLQKGLWQLGFDNILLVDYRSISDDDNDTTTSTLMASWLGGITPRYFLMDNLSLGLSLNAFYQLQKDTIDAAGATTETESTDTGFMGFVTANYYIRLGNSLFLRPGIGAGYFMGTREKPSGTEGVKLETSLSGMAGLLDLSLEYFASAHFSLRGGPLLIMRFGTETPEGADEGLGYTQIDAGFIGGLGYSF